MQVLSFGEILWDIFPDKKVIGGAPFNFSAHLAKLGAQVSFVTEVGDDELGEQTLECIREKNVSDRLTGKSAYPTGACFVTVDAKGSPSYELRYDMAYDHIELDPGQWRILTGSTFNAFYFGTLAQRHTVSRGTLTDILGRCRFEHLFFDINIRQSWYTAELLDSGMRACTILKVSREEAGVFEETGLTAITRDSFPTQQSYHLALCRDLAHHYDIDTILLTLDKEGAMVYRKETDAVLFSEVPQGKVIATVGAGDSFSACYLYHFLKGDPIEECLHKAIVLSDYVVGHTEAIPDYSPELRKLLAE